MVTLTVGLTRLQLVPASLISLNNISFYNPASNTFSAQFPPLGGGPNTSPTLATARSNHTQTTLLDGRVLITGGYTGASGTSPGSPIASVEVFNPQTGLISAGPPMASTRVDHTATRLPDGRVVIVGKDHLLASSDKGVSWTPIGEPLPYEGGGVNGARGVTYSARTKTFFLWRFDCATSVPSDAIMSAGFDYETQ